MQTEWIDTAAFSSSRRYARVSSLLLMTVILIPFISLERPTLNLPAVQPLVLDMRFQELLVEQAASGSEKRRILTDESSFVVPEVEKKKETPPQPPKTVVPEAPKPKPKVRPKEQVRPRPVRRTAPPKATVRPSKPQPGSVTAAVPHAAKAEASATSKQQALQILVQEIERRKRYPKQARRIGAQGIVTLLIHIGTDGKVQRCTVGKSCGVRVLDLETARLGSKLVGLDTGVHGAAFSVRVPVRYTLH